MIEHERNRIRSALAAASSSRGVAERLERQITEIVAMLPRRRTSAATMIGCTVVAFVGFAIFGGYLVATAGELPRPIRSNIYMLSAAGALLFMLGAAFILTETLREALGGTRSRRSAIGVVHWFASALLISTMSSASPGEGGGAEPMLETCLHLWVVAVAFLLLCAVAAACCLLTHLHRHHETMLLEHKLTRLEIAALRGADSSERGRADTTV